VPFDTVGTARIPVRLNVSSTQRATGDAVWGPCSGTNTCSCQQPNDSSEASRRRTIVAKPVRLHA
jgi:hypothetical protein